MIVLALSLVAAWGAPVDVERGWVAIAEGRPAEALGHARAALADDDDLATLWLYASALDAAGLGAAVGAELDALALTTPSAAAAAAWYRGEVGGDRAALAAVPSTPDGAFVTARLALVQGDPATAVAALPAPSTAAERSVHLDALLALGRDKEAATAAGVLLDRHPDRLDLLVPLFAVRAPTGAVAKARKRALKAIDAVLSGSRDASALYRVRQPLLAVGDSARLAVAADALVRAGEPRPRDHATWGAAMRRSMARGLALTRGPVIPEGDPAEMREIGLLVAEALRDMGRVEEALGVYESVRARADAPDVAVAHADQLLRMNRPDEALKVAGQAAKLAARPAADDVARLDHTRWRHEVAAADLLSAKALIRMERLDEAAVFASRAALMWPEADAWVTLATIRAGMRDGPAAFAALATARSLGAAVDDGLAGLWEGAADWEAAAEVLAGVGPPPGPAPATPADARRARIGDPIPSFSVTTVEGELTSDSLAGQVVVVAFFASWCGPCKAELPALAALAARHRRAGHPVTVVALSVDDRERDYLRFVADVDAAGVRFAWAPSLGRDYRVRALPTTWVVDAAGIARFFHQGYTTETDEVLDREIRSLFAQE